MDPCPFVRLTVGNFALKTPLTTKPNNVSNNNSVHPSSSPCYCTIKLKHFPPQNAVVSHTTDSNGANPPMPAPNEAPSSVTFHLSKSDVDRLTGKTSLLKKAKRPVLKVYVYAGRVGTACAVRARGRLLGKVRVPLDELHVAESRAVVICKEWVGLGGGSGRFYISVRAEPEPRFVFEFGGAPECSPQIFQVKGNVRQPVFTCKFGFRTADRNQRSRSLPLEHTNSGGPRAWLASFNSERERPGKERKGWSITIHDLSGSPVAVASMVTPFVASPGSDRVSRSNPGCWLILRPGDNTWKPWGRLEAWRERGTGGSTDGLGYRFELIPDSTFAGSTAYKSINDPSLSTTSIVLAESTLSCSKGGKFVVEVNNGVTTPRSGATSPGCSPRGSGDFGYGLWPYCMYKGFVMAASVAGEGGGKGAAPVVEVGVRHVGCTEDAAAFVALGAALDLSVDACKLFSQKLRKELCPPQDLLF